MEGNGLGIKGKMGGIGICGRVGKRGKKGCKISPTYRVKYREISNARCETTKYIWMRRMIPHA